MNAITWPVVVLAAIVAILCPPLLFIACYFWFRRDHEPGTTHGTDEAAFFAEREIEMRDRP